MSDAEAIALSWSGGKDSALALWALRPEGREPAALLTTITEDYDRVTMHAVRSELLRAQALASPPLDRVPTIAFADLFLAGVREYREDRLAQAARSGLFPLWDRDTAKLGEVAVRGGFAFQDLLAKEGS